MSQQFDCAIVGGGMVGATLACLLAQQGRSVAVIERALAEPLVPGAPFDLRVSALSRQSQQVFVDLGVWPSMHAMRVTPYEAMCVWDERGGGEIRFDAAQMNEPDLGHIVENRVISLALQAQMRAEPNITLYAPVGCEQPVWLDDGVHLTLESGECLQAQLLVGADGVRSRVRDWASIPFQKTDYGQKGLVCTVKTEQSHEYTAWQHFLATGSLAFLPLADEQYCSIVWSLPADRADSQLHLQEVAFKQQLAEALGHRLGQVLSISERAAFPLQGVHADTYIAERTVLVGDSAHAIHPLAGQGVNLGIKDVLALAQALQGISDLGLRKYLRRYERARRADNALTLKAMEQFDWLFKADLLPWRLLRNQGMNLLDQQLIVKQCLARRAMGV